MELQRWNQWAGIGSFFVGVIGVALLVYQIQHPVSPTPNSQFPPTTTTDGVGGSVAILMSSAVEWLPVGLIVLGIIAGGAFHLAAAKASSSVRANDRREVAKGERRVEWESAAEKKTAALSAQPKEMRPIPDGEFELSELKDRHSLHLRVQNLKEEPKIGYQVSIVDVRLWSEKLNGGAGAFAGHPEFLNHNKPVPIVESGGRAGFLDHVDPKRFDLVRHPSQGPWHLAGKGGEHITLKDGVWKLGVELQWNGGVMASHYCVRLNTASNGLKTFDFVSQKEEARGSA